MGSTHMALFLEAYTKYYLILRQIQKWNIRKLRLSQVLDEVLFNTQDLQIK